MKRKYAIIIVISSSIGLLSNIIDALFYETGNPVINLILLLKYFTILSNIIVLAYFANYLFGKDKLPMLLGGAVINITITFIMYGLFLSSIYHPKGFLAVANIFNHYLTPILVIGFISYYRMDYSFKQKDISKWFIFPAVYLVFLFTHGFITNDYIYPFLNPTEVGIFGVIGFTILLFALFAGMSFLLVKIISKK